MANKIILKKTSTASKVPLSSDLDVGEIAINLADQRLYSKNASGTVILVGSGAGGSGTVTSVDATVPSFLSVSGNPITTSGTLAFSLASTPANGQLLIGNGTGFSYATLTQGSGISITNNAGSITIAATGGGGGGGGVSLGSVVTTAQGWNMV
jgi:hypothetical protein